MAAVFDSDYVKEENIKHLFLLQKFSFDPCHMRSIHML